MNKKFLAICLSLALLSVNVFSQTSSDENIFDTVPFDAGLDDLDEEFIAVTPMADDIFADMPPTDENGVVGLGGGNQCGEIIYDAYNSIYGGVISESGDEDWYYGYRSGANTLRFVLVPPYNKDYGIKIYTSCTLSPINCNSGAAGVIENCTTVVNGYFYIKVYGVNGDYSPTGIYWVNSHPSQSCNVDVYNFSISSGVTCNNPVNVSATVQNNNSVSLGANIFQDLWYPTGEYYADSGANANLSAGSTFPLNTPFYPPSGGWPLSGNYLGREFSFAYCAGTNALAIDKAQANGSVNCQQCTDECSSGDHQCSGSYSQSCGNWDTSDICLEWGNNVLCQNGCNTSSGLCNSCTNECSFNGELQCFGDSLKTCGQYDGDSCLEWNSGQYCGDDVDGANYCSNNDVWENDVLWYCANDACQSSPDNHLVQDCGLAGCSSGQCLSCNSHDHQGCFNDDVYWFDSCNQAEELIDDCRLYCQNNSGLYSCMDGCLGSFSVVVKNTLGQIEANAVVSFKDQTQTGFNFVGLTDSQGRLDFSHITPVNFCPVSYNVKVVSAGGADCGENGSLVGSDGDYDYFVFTCPIANNSNSVFVLPNVDPLEIGLGQALSLGAQTRDLFGVILSNVLVGVNRPYNSIPLSDVSDSGGLVSFLDQSPPAGSHNFQFIGSKVGYNYGEAWKQVTVHPQQAAISVIDSTGQWLWNVEVFLGSQSVGFTNNQGKLFVDVNQTVNTFHAVNAGIDCGYKTISVGEQANFICPSTPKLRVDVDNNYGLPLANVVVAIDGEFVDYSNAFGFVKTPVTNGTHLLEIYYQLDENRPIFRHQRNIEINSELKVESFVVSEQNGELVSGESGLSLQTVDGEAIPIIAIIVIAYGIYDHVSPFLDAIELCSCVSQHSSADYQQCFDTITACINPGQTDVCIDNAKQYLSFPEECHLDYAAMGIDILPGIAGAGLVKKAGVTIGEATGKLKAVKLPETAQNIFSTAKIHGENAWEMVGHQWKYASTWIDAQARHILQITLELGGRISPETSEVIETAAKSIYIGEAPALRTIQGIDQHVIPDSVDHANRLLDYSKKALDQGFEPYAESIHKLQKVYKREGINVQVGGQFVSDTIVLKKGSAELNFGWEHIIDGGHNLDIQEALQLSDSEDSVVDVIKEVIEQADPNDITYISGEAWEIRKTVTRNGVSHNILVVISDRPNNIGSIQTAHPIN